MGAHKYISGIQQVGIGVKKLRENMLLYKALFGMNVLIFDDTSEASLMTQYTGDKVYKRQAILTMNLAGGGGFELWQYLNKEPLSPVQKTSYGDIGIYAAKIKCENVQTSHHFFSPLQNIQLSPIVFNPQNEPHFWVKDQQGNCFNIIESKEWFKHTNAATGGVAGAVIGVTDMDKAIEFYTKLLGETEVIFDNTGTYSDNEAAIPTHCRRVMLRKKTSEFGAFKKLLGGIDIELVQCLERQSEVIYKNRYWGDCGFIHLCFDVIDMCALKKHLSQTDIHFTVDSKNSFSMEDSAGRFCYTEDPDGTLIELVETHKIPIFKKLGLYLNLKKRNQQKPLPDWMISLLALSKVK